jgi:hypothetical protein
MNTMNIMMIVRKVSVTLTVWDMESLKTFLPVSHFTMGVPRIEIKVAISM